MVPPGFTTIEMQRESNEQIVDVGFVCFSSWFRLVFTLFFSSFLDLTLPA